ncbi:DUF2235 domain-containing protein [Mycolicibacterium mageritense]|nr:hypothetical protein MTY414_61740 [Mycolicibacterium mageritense]
MPGKLFYQVFLSVFVTLPGVVVKNIVLCFDHTDERPGPRDATNIQSLFRLLESGPEQVGWYHSGASSRAGARKLGRRDQAAAGARAAVIEAYRFLDESWEPGDEIYLFGGRHGGHRAFELAALLGTVGLMPECSDDLLEYALATYVLPRTLRSPQDWERLSQLTADLAGEPEIAVPVRFLGLFDALGIPGARHEGGPLTNVDAGRHALPIDGGPALRRDSEHVDEVWFRGGQCDIAGGTGACWPLADIALDWMLAGATEAGLLLHDRTSCPNELDALAGTVPTLRRRQTPVDAHVHASVEMYVRAHPQYWKRLPARIEWADVDWLARGERLLHRPTEAFVEHEVLTAAAS